MVSFYVLVSVCTAMKALACNIRFLRAEPKKPDCDRHPNVDALVRTANESQCC